MEAIVFYISFEIIGEYSGMFPSFTWGIFCHMMYVD